MALMGEFRLKNDHNCKWTQTDMCMSVASKTDTQSVRKALFIIMFAPSVNDVKVYLFLTDLFYSKAQ